MGWTGRAGNNANVLESKGQKEGEEIIIRGWVLESVMLEGEQFGVTTL